MGIVTLPGFQEALHLAYGDSGIRDFHLDIVAPVAGIGLRRAAGGGLLQRRQLVQHPGRHHLARQAARHHLGRHREGLDDQLAGMCAVPHHVGKSRRDRDTDKSRRHPKQDAKPPFPDAKMEMFELFVEVVTLIINQRALFTQKGALVIKESIGCLATGPVQRQCDSSRINASSNPGYCLCAGILTFGFLIQPGPLSPYFWAIEAL
jgi:hypothetical protein